MDVFKEINVLPNFGYIFTDNIGKVHIAILGGHSCESTDFYEFVEMIIQTNSSMEQIYNKDELSDEEKVQLAKLMKRMHSICEKRKNRLHTLSEQRAYIESLTVEEKLQIERQILMHKDCRSFYRDFIHKS